MAFNRRNIFRNKAIEMYRKQQYEAVFPRFLHPRTFLFIWALLGLLLLLSGLAWITEVPFYISGRAVVTGETASNAGQLAILLPAGSKSTIQVGQTVHILEDGIEVREISQVTADVLSPEVATAVYNLAPGFITTPTIVALAPFTTTTFSAAQYQGSLYTVQIEAGSQRLLASVPLIGQFWGGANE